jgi:cell division septal protein FtsQ
MSDKKESTRAELVRQRRGQEQTKRMNRVVSRTTRPMPAITSRSHQNTPKKKPAHNARRRFQIALPAAGNAMRSVHIPRPRFGWRLASFVLSALLGTVLYYAFNLPQLRVVEVQVTGNQIVTPAEINSVMNVAGQPVFLLSASDLETRLRLNYPELATVRVTVSLPNLVAVEISERKPVIRWEQGGGYTWIADDGVAFRPRGEVAGLISVVAESAPGPERTEAVDPLHPAPYLSVQMIQTLKGLSSHVPPGGSILYDGRMGFGWNDPRGWSAYFGITSHDVELKMKVYESMVSSLEQRGIRPALINVTYPTAPYYRMTQ